MERVNIRQGEQEDLLTGLDDGARGGGDTLSNPLLLPSPDVRSKHGSRSRRSVPAEAPIAAHTARSVAAETVSAGAASGGSAGGAAATSGGSGATSGGGGAGKGSETKKGTEKDGPNSETGGDGTHGDTEGEEPSGGAASEGRGGGRGRGRATVGVAGA